MVMVSRATTQPSILTLSVHVHTPKQVRVNKLSDRSKVCVHVGCSAEGAGYRLYRQATSSVIVSRDVVFVEDQFVDPSSRLSRHRVGEGELSAFFPDAGVRIPVSSTGGSA